MNLKCLPCPQNQCWVSIWWLWVLGTQIWDNLNFFKKFEKFKFFEKKMKCNFFACPPPPSINVGHIRGPGHPTTNIDNGGRGFSFFHQLSQIFCTWLSEFWPKSWYFAKSNKGLLMPRFRWNLLCAWSKSMKTTFYDVNHLTRSWPPLDPWGFTPT